ncbi:MAG: hypothetical protein Q7T26_03925 [Dehalococcoidia bacterium]|nr:hypothetical protein [Dehalococcoidia bacterium]
MPDEWVSVATAPDLQAAEAIVRALRSAGVEAMLSPSQSGPWDAGWSASFQVVVRKGQEDAAKAALERSGRRNGHGG